MLNFFYKDIQDYIKFWEEWFQKKKKKERKTRVILLIMLVVNNLEKVPQGLQ